MTYYFGGETGEGDFMGCYPRARRALSRAALRGLIAVVIAIVADPAVGSDASPRLGVIAGQYIVVLRDHVKHPADVAQAQTDRFGSSPRFVYRHALAGYSAKLSAAAVDALSSNPQVAYISPDVRGSIAAQTTPTGLRRIFAAENPSLAINQLDDIRADVDVAVFDTGIDYQHTDLNVVERTDCSNGAVRAEDCVDNSGTDGNGHGTHVAGTIAALDNGTGVTGVAPGARLWSVKVLDSGGFGDLSEYIAGIDWVTARAGTIEVANSSIWHPVTSNQAFTDAMNRSIAAGVVHVVSAGNQASNVRYVPDNHPNAITVSAIADYDGRPGSQSLWTCENRGADDSRASFSNYGPLVDVAAPGVCIYSTRPGNQYGYESGTSMAAPHVTGAAALLAMQINPNSQADVAEIRDVLVNAGNAGWTDTSGDGIREPLLDVRNPAAFRLGAIPPGWGVMPTPNPSGARESYLLGVACTERDDCTTVGQFKSSSGVWGAHAHGWDGTQWKALPAITNPGTGYGALNGVSCWERVECMTVGEYVNSAGTMVSLAEARDAAVWWVQTTPNPAGARFTRLLDVSCTPSPDIGRTTCTAVGSYVDSSNYFRPLGMRWNGSSWSLSAPVVPPGSEPIFGPVAGLYGVACPSADWCMTVGSYDNDAGNGLSLAELRTGAGTWSIVSTPNPSGARDTHLNAISCVSQTACTAVGYYTTASERFPLAMRWNGSSWQIQTVPRPVTAVTAELTGVSCTTITSCVAAGEYGTGGANGAMAWRWDGVSWALEPVIVNPGVSPAGFEGISCAAVSSCAAVGSFTNALNTPVSFAEHLFPAPGSPLVTTSAASDVSASSATLNGTVNPNGLSTEYHFEYGLTTAYGATAPVPDGSITSALYTNQAVSQPISGLQPNTTYHYRLVASNSRGRTNGTDGTFTTPMWIIQNTLNAPGASHSYLYAVGCEPASTELCTAVGKSTSAGVDAPMAERWDGTRWSLQAPALKSGATHTRLLGVDCPSTIRCIAVGNSEVSGSGTATLAELWNEGRWSVQSTPIPAGATSSELVDVGCNSTANCTAAGSAVIGGVKTAIAERWNSPTWALHTIPIPAGATSSQLDGVDCLWSNFCVAVGRYTTSGGAIRSLAMFWNGTSWLLQTLTDPREATQSTLLDVSCTPSPNLCTAVGGWKIGSQQYTLAYRFNGSSWTLQSTPNPSGSIASVFQEVSCATPTSCTAAGSWVSGSGGSNQTLAEHWDGSSWAIQTTPNPSGTTFSAFFGAACRVTTCIAVGWSTDALGAATTMAAARG